MFSEFHNFPRCGTVDFFQSLYRGRVCPLALVVGFAPHMIRYCVMHFAHLGISQWLNASVFLALCDHGVFGALPADKYTRYTVKYVVY